MKIVKAGVDITGKYTQAELESITIGFLAELGEPGSGTLPIPDAAGTLAFRAGESLVIKSNDGAHVVLNGFVGATDTARGETAGGTRKLPSVTIIDENALLWGIRAFRWSRPSESDRARWLAWCAKYLPTLDTTWILNANLITFKKKKYSEEESVSALLDDMADSTAKNLFVVDRAVHWHLTTEGDTADLAISDDASEFDYATIFPPMNPTRRQDPADLANDVLAYNQKGETARETSSGSIAQHNAWGIHHQRLMSLPDDTKAQMRSAALGVIQRRKDERITYECEIGPLTHAQVGKIPKGALINVTSAVLGLDHSTQRIGQLALRYLHPDLWVATVTMGYPVRTRKPPADTTPAPPTKPWAPLAAGDFVYVQSTKTGTGVGATGSATFASAPTAGNWIFGVALLEQPGGAGLHTADCSAIWPDGWVEDFTSGTDSDTRMLFMSFAHKASDGTETTVAVDLVGAGVHLGGYLVMEEDEGPEEIAVGAFDAGTYTPSSATVTTASILPESGQATLLIIGAGHEPDYSTTIPSPWTKRQEYLTGGGNRQALSLYSRVVTSAIGTYGATITGAGGTDDYWMAGIVAYQGAPATPAPGQLIAPELVGTGDGSTTAYQTNYDYAAGSVAGVVTVDGVPQIVTETDPTTGTFTLASPAPVGAAVIVGIYTTDTGTPSGTSNPAPTAVSPDITPLPTGVTGHVLAYDGSAWRSASPPEPALLEDGTIAILENGHAAMLEPVYD